MSAAFESLRVSSVINDRQDSNVPRGGGEIYENPVRQHVLAWPLTGRNLRL